MRSCAAEPAMAGEAAYEEHLRWNTVYSLWV